MVGFHVLNDEIVGRARAYRIGNVIKPFMGKFRVNGVHDRDPVVRDDVRVIRHTVRNGILSLEKINSVIVDTYIKNIVCYSHFRKALS